MSAERFAQCFCNLNGIDGFFELKVQRNHLQIFSRQQGCRFRNEGGVATELNAVLGCAQHGGANAFTCRQKWNGNGVLIKALTHSFTKQFAQITEVPHFAAVHILAYAAREHDAIELAPIVYGVCEVQVGQVFACEFLRQNTHQCIGHPLRHLGQILARNLIAQFPIEARLLSKVSTCGVKSGEHIFFVHHHEAATQVHGSRGNQLAVLHQAQFGGASANVDVQNPMFFIVGAFGSARAVNGQHGFHVVARRCAHKFAALLCQHRSNRLAVLTAQGFTGQDHGTGIDLIGMQARVLVGLVNDGAQGFGVHQAVVQIRREGDGGLVQGRAFDHGVAAGQIFGNAAQMDA